ncbi:MAG: hypothetical protein RID53_29820 [Coleofasciculus sp. B1-GNL1-01]|uniref:hypothetical protein n=1 Tax=Coleofasciculus sp. B1-GNL1-01 TaxID=3068484 RepID=UPI0032FB2735
MALFLITSVCDEGVYESNFKVVEAESKEAIAQDMLDNPYRWEQFLRSTTVWWDLTYYEYKYGEPRGWSPKELLEQIDSTYVDGDSYFQVRIHEIKTIEKVRDKSGQDAS